MRPQCTVPDCERPSESNRGWCKSHYNRWARTGDVGTSVFRNHPPFILAPAVTRFVRMFDAGEPSECWVWRGAKVMGYGCLRVDGKVTLAHRFSYELFIGPIPAGLHIDHLCVNPPCVNPTHMEPVTAAENTRRAAERARPATHCKRGHPFDEANTHYRTDHRGRVCRACDRIRGPLKPKRIRIRSR